MDKMLISLVPGKAPAETGSAGYASWDSITAMMRQAGYVKPAESLLSLAVTDHGVTFFVTRTESEQGQVTQ